MAGSYCRYCANRCFVYRQVRVGGELIWAGHMATCPQGKAHDRAVLGEDADTATNPLTANSPTDCRAEPGMQWCAGHAEEARLNYPTR